MEVLKNISQLYSILNKALQLGNEFDLEQKDFVFKIQSEQDLLPLANHIKAINISKEDFNVLTLFIFQLTDYTTLVANLCHVFMLAKKFEEVFVLGNKIFVAHIGPKPYTSSKSTQSSERNFDRIVELVGVANISNKTFLNFLIAIQKNENAPFSAWKTPALEYLQNFFVGNETWLMEFIKLNPELKYATLQAVCNFNATKGVELLMKEYLFNPECDKEQVIEQLKDFKREVVLYTDTSLAKLDELHQVNLIEILLEMSADNEIMSRLQDIYANTTNEQLKTRISTFLGISSTMNIRTEKQFLYAARRKIKSPQERTLGVPFDQIVLHTASGEEATNTVFTFIIFLFKEEKNFNNLYKLKVLENIFVKDELSTFAERVFETLKRKDDILQAKWCVRMFALLSSNTSLDETFNFLTTLLNQERTKEAKYLINCLIYSKRVEIIDFLRFSLEENQLFIKENLEEFISSISTCLNIHTEDIKDMLVPNEFSIGEFDIQRDRLFNAFLSAKTYPFAIFKKLFIENQIYNKLAQNLVFGEYRHGRLYNAFVIENGEIKFIVGQSIFENDVNKDGDITIGIIHPLDCDFRFQPAFSHFPSPTFNQFKEARFNNTDLPVATTTINRFSGVMINPQKFLKYVFNNGFQPNCLEFDEHFKSIIHILPVANLLTEVEFEKPLNTESSFDSLSIISFYKLSDTMQSQGKYLTQKANALAVSSIPNRYYNHIMSIIFEASKL